MSLLNSLDKLTLVVNGDSWTFGSEIVAPELIEKNAQASHVCNYDFYSDNDYYRLPRIYPSYLAEQLNADVVNLAWPADDNGSILRRTINYVNKNYIEANKSTDNLFVIVGWSSPERTSFWFKDNEQSELFRLWPNVPAFTHPAQEKIWELYVSYLWNAEEYIPRFILTCLQFETFCVKHKIKFLQFNAFYQTPKANIDRWEDLNIAEQAKQIQTFGYMYSDSRHSQRQHQVNDYLSLWNSIDAKRFYRKDLTRSTFKNFIESCGLEQPYCTEGQGSGWHPNADAHRAWAEELHRYIIENKLL